MAVFEMKKIRCGSLHVPKLSGGIERRKIFCEDEKRVNFWERLGSID